MEDFQENFRVPVGDYPPLLKLLNRKKISKETFIILQDCIRFFGAWNKQITDTVLWPAIAMNCRKLYPFLKYEKDKYNAILKNKIKAGHTSQHTS